MKTDESLKSAGTYRHTDVLARSYLEILSGCDLGTLFRGEPDLSGIFLPTVPANFANATYRLLVVGMETKAWRNNECKFKLGQVPTIDAVVESMRSHGRWLERPPGPHKFLQFLRQVKSSMHTRIPGADVAVGWGNLFCVSRSGRSPTAAASLADIQALSQRLLRAHITATDPDLILFTTGAAYDRFLRDCFPDRSASVAIEPRCLWQFRVGRALCYRTSHPRYVAHNQWRDEALELAANHLLLNPAARDVTAELV
ncbi:hypothetical protein [Paraburkholderia sediminicola]|uniref:hypothetical protein n=1 Tax=Paraburkholderia sediminicola TaxID=458836 RepID=UPI0038B8582F